MYKRIRRIRENNNTYKLHVCIIAILSFFSFNLQSNIINYDVLLIINFNNPHYENILFLKSIYKDFFPNIVFCGDKKTDQVEYSYQGSMPPYNLRGHMSYKAIAKFMKKYPQYKGYLFVHDDCLINFWNLFRFDKNKIWISQPRYISFNDIVREQGYRCWTEACFLDIRYLLKLFKKLSNQQYYNNLIKNKYGKQNLLWAFSDICYIPQKYSKDLILLDRYFNKENIIIELGLPMMLACLDDISNCEILQGLNFEEKDRKNTKGLCSNYSSNYDWIHPYKFSNNEIKKFVKIKFNELGYGK